MPREAILGLEPVWLQNALPVLQLHCDNDDFGALGFRMPREAFLGPEAGVAFREAENCLEDAAMW